MTSTNESMTGRKIIVTGSGGISAATALRCANHGALVHVIARNPSSASKLAGAHANITWSAADLSSDEESADAFSQAEKILGSVDGLVAVAGGSARRMGDGPVDALSTSGLNATIALNLTTTVNALREFTSRWIRAPRTEQRASAVLIGSTLGHFPASPLFVTHGYAAAKAAIEGLARSTAAHYSHDSLTVNVVAPGLTRTPMAARAAEDEVVSAYARTRQPLAPDGFVGADDVAEACEWVLGARMVTGQVIYVDAGWSIYGG